MAITKINHTQLSNEFIDVNFFNKNNYRKSLPAPIKKLRLESNVCVYCGKICTNDLTVDHIVPRINGGSNNENNLVICCKSCNSSKKHGTVERFRKLCIIKKMDLRINVDQYEHIKNITGIDLIKNENHFFYFESIQHLNDKIKKALESNKGE